MNLIPKISHPLRAGLCALAFAALAVQPTQAADFPPEQIRIVVPFAAGGGADVIMRIVAKHMADGWKVNILIDNRVGAGGVVGSQHVTQQKPDGRTFRPHVTLAYLKRQVSQDRVAAWIANHNLLASPTWRASGFGLYSSWRSAEGSRYDLEREYPLF